MVFALVEASTSSTGYKKIRDALRTNHFLGELVNARPILNELSYKYISRLLSNLVSSSLEPRAMTIHGAGTSTATTFASMCSFLVSR